jgi:hypothetical protein
MFDEQQHELAIEQKMLELEKVLASCRLEDVAQLSEVQQAFRIGRWVDRLARVLSDDVVQAVLMPLQGSALGFRTDKDRQGGYPLEIVRECAIEALIRGFRIAGNEFNIIDRRFYATKSGLERKVAEFPGLSSLELKPGTPQVDGNIAHVPYRADWLLNGSPMSIVCDQVFSPDGSRLVEDKRLQVPAQKGLGVDAVVGKATRKMLAKIYRELIGAKLGLEDGDIDDTRGLDVSSENRAPASGNRAPVRLRGGHQ